MNPMSDLPPLVEEDLYFLNKSILFTLYKGSTDVEPYESCESRWIHPCNNHLGKSKNFVPIWMILLLPGLFCFSIRNDIQDLKKIEKIARRKYLDQPSGLISQRQLWLPSESMASILFNWTFWKISLKIFVWWYPIRISENKPSTIINRLFGLTNIFEPYAA